MTIQLALQGNTASQNLSATTYCRTRRYVPKSPETQARFTDPLGWNGEEMIDFALGTVTESTEVTFVGTASQIRTTVNNIERVFSEARQWASGVRWGAMAYQPYVTYDPDGNMGAYPYMSPILDGRIDLADDALNTQWISGAVDATVTWTRRPYWQGQELASLTLGQSVRGSATTLLVDNCDDQYRDNWVSITGSDIVGDVPTPALIQITVSDASYLTARNIWMGAATWIGANTNYPLFFDAEFWQVSGSPYPYHAAISDGTASNSQFDTVTWSGTTRQALYQITLTPTILGVVNAGYFRLMGRLFGMPANSDVLVNARIDADGVTLWRGPQVLVQSAAGSTELVDMGLVRVPPALTGLGTYQQMYLVIEHQRPSAGAGTTTINWDYFHLMPTDGYRKYTAVGAATTAAIKIIDDGPRGLVYTDMNPGGSAAYMPRHVVTGQAVWLQPGRNSRLYFLRDRQDGTMHRSAPLSIQVSYYPRKLLV